MASMSSMLICEGNMRPAAAGFIGAKSDQLTLIAGEAPLFGLVNHGYIPPGQLVALNRPIAISQLRMKWVTLTPFTTAQGMVFEAHKTTVTTNFDAGAPANPKRVLAQRKKFSGYAEIPETEIDVLVASGAALTGGNHVAQGSTDAPFDLAAIGGTTIPAGESIWYPEDGAPLVIEQGEGILVHNVLTMGAAGVGILFVGIDFFRF